MNYEAIKIPPASFICGFADLASCAFAAGERFSNIKYPGCPRMTLWVVLYTLRPCSTRTKSPLSLQDGVWFRVGRMTYTDLGRHKFTATRMWFPYGKQSIKRTVLFFLFLQLHRYLCLSTHHSVVLASGFHGGGVLSLKPAFQCSILELSFDDV